MYKDSQGTQFVGTSISYDLKRSSNHNSIVDLVC